MGKPKFPIQLEFLDNKKLTHETSKLNMQIILRKVEFRNQLIQTPFANGLNFVHNRLQELLKEVKLLKMHYRIIYWTATIFLSIGMIAGGIQQLLQIGGYNSIVSSLGYPFYLLNILETWKLLGVLVLLIPKFLILKEWAYVGFFFARSGAFISHLAVGHSFAETVPLLILIFSKVLSWFLMPPERKIVLN